MSDGDLQTREHLHAWIRERLRLPADTAQALHDAIDQVLHHYERTWEESKEQAVRAVLAGAARRLARMREEVEAGNTTVHNVAEYFEQVVSDLTERTHRDAKTQLLTFQRFMDRVEVCLATGSPGFWCAYGVADITGFKRINDRLGHAAGDRIIARVASLLRSEIRASDLLAYQQTDASPAPLHARFGGDEFCFFLTDLPQPQTAVAVVDRYRRAVVAYDWSRDDVTPGQTPVTVDVGLVCMRFDTEGRRATSMRAVAEQLFERADRCLYAVKQDRSTPGWCERVQLDHDRLSNVDEAS